MINMTKVQAIEALMRDYNGAATWRMIYGEIEKYYPNIKAPKDWKAALRGVLYRDLGKTFKKLDSCIYALIDYDISKTVPQKYKDICVEKDTFVKIRTAQQRYRKELLSALKCCPITGENDKRLLTASHIKPWCFAEDCEKVDIYNGFILSPVYDRLFDSGLITFTASKQMLLSSTLSAETVSRLNIKAGIYPDLPVEGREKYLCFHNEKIFIE